MELNDSIERVFEEYGVVLNYETTFEDFGPSGPRFRVFKFNSKGGYELFVWIGEPGCGGMIEIRMADKFSAKSFKKGNMSVDESLRAFLSSNRVYIDMLNGVREVEHFIDWMGQK
jgi:hypothetical protein